MKTNPMRATHIIELPLSQKILTIGRYQRLLNIKSENIYKAKEDKKSQGTLISTTQ